MKVWLICGIVLALFAAGCISPEIEKGTPEEYELLGLQNTTVFYLNGSFIQVVEHINNMTSVRIVTGEAIEFDIKHPVAVNYSGANVFFKVSQEKASGKSFARFDFEAPFNGYVAFTQPDGQDFSRPLLQSGAVMVVLPPNFTTGSRFLGIARPEPDTITLDRAGREVLIWDNPYPEFTSISVKYYHESAPRVLAYFFLFLFLCALLILVHYRKSMHDLRKKRKIIHQKGRK